MTTKPFTPFVDPYYDIDDPLRPFQPEPDLEGQKKIITPQLKAIFPEDDPGLVLEWAASNPDKFFDILERTKKPEGRILFDYFMQQVGPAAEALAVPDYSQEFAPLGPDEPRNWFDLARQTIHPEMEYDEFVGWFNTQVETSDLTEFTSAIVDMGRTPQTESILRDVGASDDDVVAIFGGKFEVGEDVNVEEQLSIPKEEASKLTPIDKSWYVRQFDLFVEWRNKTNESIDKLLGGGILGEKGQKSFIAGSGDIISILGGISRRFGQDDIGEELSSFGSTLQNMAPPSNLGDFDISDLADPEFYQTKVARTVPFALSLAPLAIGGFYGGAAIAGALGIGTIGTMIIGGLTSAVLSRPVESAMEAGGTYDDVLAQGGTEQEAKEAFDKVFRENLLLAGLDAWEIGIALAPTPKWVPSQLVKSGLAKVIRVAGKMIIVGLTEGGEEAVQDIIGRRAKGEEIKLDPVMAEAIALGAIMGLGMGFGGDVITGVIEKGKKVIPTNRKKQFDLDVEGFKAEGFNQELAELKALDIAAQDPQTREAIEKVIAEEAPIPATEAVEGITPAPVGEVAEVTLAREPTQIENIQGRITLLQKEIEKSELGKQTPGKLDAQRLFQSDIDNLQKELVRIQSVSTEPLVTPEVTPEVLDKSGVVIEGLGGQPVKLNSDGTITLFHRTTPEIAERIRQTGIFQTPTPSEEVFFSNLREGQAEGFGDAVVEVRLLPSQVSVDDAFPSGEVHVSATPSDIKIKPKVTPEVTPEGKLPGIEDVEVEASKRGMINLHEYAAITLRIRSGIVAKLNKLTAELDKLEAVSGKDRNTKRIIELRKEIEKIDKFGRVPQVADEYKRYIMRGEILPEFAGLKQFEDVTPEPPVPPVGEVAVSPEELVGLRNRKEIQAKLQEIFGTYEDLEKMDSGELPYTIEGDVSLDYMADLEYAAVVRDLEETRSLLKAVYSEINERIGKRVAKPAVTPKPKVTPEVTPEAKEPWMMTREELFQSVSSTVGGVTKPYSQIPKSEQMAIQRRYGARHEKAVQQAISEGKTVPAEVLADYPDLKARLPSVEGVPEPSEISQAPPAVPAAEAPAEVAPEDYKPEPLPKATKVDKKELATTKSVIPDIPNMTEAQVDFLLNKMGDLIDSPTLLTNYDLQAELYSMVRGERASDYHTRFEELVLDGKTFKEAHEIALGETMRGELPKLTSDYFGELNDAMAEAFRAKVYYTFSGKDQVYKRISTLSALTNMLAGKQVPYTPVAKGGIELKPYSALQLLREVFSKQPKLIKAIERSVKEEKPFTDIVNGIFRDYVEGGRPPIPIDEVTAEYLRNLTTFERQQVVLGMEVPVLTGEKPITGEPYKEPPTMPDNRTDADKLFAKRELEIAQELAEGKIDFDEFQLKRMKARDEAYPLPLITKFDAPIDKAFKMPPMFNFMEQSVFNRVLKEILWSPIDIGNFMRANKASFDNSFLRQSKLLASGHPIVAWKAHTTAWQSMFSQRHTEMEWELITRDPDFQIYEQIRVDTGNDPLRVPAFAGDKGTERYRYSEELGFTSQHVERLIPRFTQWLPHVKYSERAFSAGTNKVVWAVWKQKLEFAKRYSDKIASGEVTLKEGEAFDIIQEMTDEQAMLGDMIQRANLRRYSGLAPAINAFFFAARSKVGRFLLPKHLLGVTTKQLMVTTPEGKIEEKLKVGFNPRVMKEAWRNFFLLQTYMGGLMFLGDWLGLWETEDDPRNAEFMSARIGKTRIDPWAGYRQFVVLYARLVTETGISSVTGAEYDVNPLGATWSFVRNSFSPLLSTLLEFWTGRNFLGQVIDFEDAKYWIEKVAPFAITDVWEAAEEDWRIGVGVTIPAVYGEGVQTYTGDWEENFTKLGLRKFVELDEPKYDTADFWSDTAKQFKGVDPETLIKEKGFPAYIKAIAEAKVIQEHLGTLPSDKLVSLNADPYLGEPTFTDYYKMWGDREKLVALGDDAEFVSNELQPDGKYKKITYTGDDAIVAFDKKNSGAEKGNFSQRQFALLNEYWLITDEESQKAFLEKHKAEIGIRPRDEWLRSHPEENAELAIWGQAKILTKEAYTEFKKLLTKYDIPDSAIPELILPPETSIDTHFEYEEMVSEGTHGSAKAELLLLEDYLKAHPTGKPKEGEPESYAEWHDLKVSDKSVDYWQMRVDNKDSFQLKDDFSDEDSPDFKSNEPKKDAEGNLLRDNDGKPLPTDREAALATLRATVVGKETFLDIERRVGAMNNGTRDNPIDPDIVDAVVKHYQIVDETKSGLSAEARLNRIDDPELNEYLMNKDYHGDNAAEPLAMEYEPIWRMTAEYRPEQAAYDKAIKGLTGSDQTKAIDRFMTGEGLTGAALKRRLEYADDMSRKTMYEYDIKGIQVITPDGIIKPVDDGKSSTIGVTEDFVGYVKEERQFNSGSAEVNLFRHRHNNLELLMNKVKEGNEKEGWMPLKYTHEQQVKIWEIDKQYSTEDEEYKTGIPEKHKNVEDPKERDKLIAQDRADMLTGNNEYARKRIERQAYEKDVPLTYSKEDAKGDPISDYISWNLDPELQKPADWKKKTGTDLWFEDDWFLMEHKDFYKEIYKGVLGKQAKDYRGTNTLPTEEVFEKYLVYLTKTYRMRENYRFYNQDLEDWMFNRGIVTTRVSEERAKAELTPAERSREDWAERRKGLPKLTPIK